MRKTERRILIALLAAVPLLAGLPATGNAAAVAAPLLVADAGSAPSVPGGENVAPPDMPPDTPPPDVPPPDVQPPPPPEPPPAGQPTDQIPPASIPDPGTMPPPEPPPSA